MKTCPHCGNQIHDDAQFCPFCGSRFQADPAPQSGAGTPPPPMGQPPVSYTDPYDHTAEFDPADISDNKVYCMVAYLVGIFGVIIGLLAAQRSPYVTFHLRQVLKFPVCETLITVVGLILFWTFLVPVAAFILWAVLYVVRIISFVQICQGKAVEPYIIRSLGFLR